MSKNKAMVTGVAKDSGHPKSEYEKQAKRIGFDVRDISDRDGHTPEYCRRYKDLYLQGEIFQGGFNIKYLSSLAKIDDKDADMLKNFALECKNDESKKKVFNSALASISKKKFEYKESAVRKLLEKEKDEPRYREQAKKIGFYAGEGDDISHKHLYLAKDGEECDKSSAPFFENLPIKHLYSLEKLDEEAITQVKVLAGECEAGIYKKEDFLKLLRLINRHKEVHIGKDEVGRLITESCENLVPRTDPEASPYSDKVVVEPRKALKRSRDKESIDDVFVEADEVCRTLGCSLSKTEDFSPSHENYILRDFSAKEDSPPHILTKHQLEKIVEFQCSLKSMSKEELGAEKIANLSLVWVVAENVFDKDVAEEGFDFGFKGEESFSGFLADSELDQENDEIELLPSGSVVSAVARNLSRETKKMRR